MDDVEVGSIDRDALSAELPELVPSGFVPVSPVAVAPEMAPLENKEITYIASVSL